MDIGDLLAPKGVVLRGGGVVQTPGPCTPCLRRPRTPWGLTTQRCSTALMEREALGSTGLGSGVAVPHARLAQIDKVTAVFVRLDNAGRL